MADITTGGSTLVGAIGSSVTIHREWWRAVQFSPDDSGAVPSSTPVLVVYTETWNSGPTDVRLQVSTSTDFSTPIVDTILSSVGGVGDKHPYQVVSALTDKTRYWWRIRAVSPGGEAQAWTAARNFLVELKSGQGFYYIDMNIGWAGSDERSATEYVYENVGVVSVADKRSFHYVDLNIGWAGSNSGLTGEYVYENVTTGTPNPMIWFLRPSFGREGDGIAIYGFGFGDLQSTFDGVVEIDWGGIIGWQSVPIVSWQTYPADPPAYTPDRVIDEMNAVVDPQHTVIEIIVPPRAIPPGYPVRVRTNGP